MRDRPDGWASMNRIDERVKEGLWPIGTCPSHSRIDPAEPQDRPRTRQTAPPQTPLQTPRQTPPPQRLPAKTLDDDADSSATDSSPWWCC